MFRKQFLFISLLFVSSNRIPVSFVITKSLLSPIIHFFSRITIWTPCSRLFCVTENSSSRPDCVHPHHIPIERTRASSSSSSSSSDRCKRREGRLNVAAVAAATSVQFLYTHLSERHRLRRTSVSVIHTTSRRSETVASCCSNMAAEKGPIIAFLLIVGCSLFGE